MNKNQDGFSIFELLFFVVTLSLLLFGGWHVYRSDKGIANKSVAPTVGWKVFQDKDLHFQLKYPPTWTAVFDTTPLVFSDQSYPQLAGSITSPSGKILIINERTVGGGGGGCPPGTADVPFAVGNNCPSKEFLSIEKVHTTFSSDAYITHTKYSAGGGSKIEYNVCLDFDLTKYQALPTIDSPTMGFLAPCEFFMVGFDVHMTVTSVEDFSSSDVQAAQTIMKSLQKF